MSPTVILLVYCLCVILASLAGGWLPSLVKLTHVRKQLTMSLVSGVMLGVALLHMLPHSVVYLPSIAWVGGSMLSGVLVMFFLLRVFHVHAHDDHHHEHADDGGHQLSWTGLLVGLTIHSLLDGVAMAASVVAEASDPHAAAPLLGLSTFLAVVLHKPLDALAITSLMRATRWSQPGRQAVNFLFALSCPLGAILFVLGTSGMSEGQNTLMGAALAFSAGFFLCIALSDLLPEVSFHSHDRVKLTLALLLGVAISIAIEMTHSHEHPHAADPLREEGDQHDHTHDHSDHVP